MTVIGVTGSSGSGRDTVSDLIRVEFNNTLVVDADYIVKNNQKPGCEYYDQIVELCGNEVINKDKSINKSYLSKRIFSDDVLRNNLNTITFDTVELELENILDENENKEYILLNFPLLFEGGFEKYCDFVVGVTADENTKAKRIVMRDNITRSDAMARINSQKSDFYLNSHCDYVVDNSDKISYSDLRENVKKIADEIKEKKDEQ